MRIDCHFAIILRITGELTDEQHAAVGRTLTRTLAGRLAAAERVLAGRHDIGPSGLRDHGSAWTGREITPPFPAPPQGSPPEPDLAAPAGAVRGTVPDDALPDDFAPDDALPDDALPDEAAPGEVVPGEVVPGEVAPGEVAPGEVDPGRTAVEEAAPGETAANEAGTGSARTNSAETGKAETGRAARAPASMVSPAGRARPRNAPSRPDGDLRVTAVRAFVGAEPVGRSSGSGRPGQKRGRVAFIERGAPDGPAPRARDEVIEKALRDARGSTPPPRPADPVVPGDRRQQRDTVVDIDPIDLWRLPRIQDALRGLAEKRAIWDRTHSGGRGAHDAAYWTDYWRLRFAKSVNYILDVRETRGYRKHSYTVRGFYLVKLKDAEAELIKASPPDLTARVEEVRRTIREQWMNDAVNAAEQFVRLAGNEVSFLTEQRPVRIYGLPEWIEGTVPASAFPKLFEQDPQSPGFSPSVARLIAAVQKEWGRAVVAENYHDHEKSNLYIGNIDGIGKYSFDVHLPLEIQKADGFYERLATTDFFLAVERAAHATDIEWMAFYNDAEVADTVNRTLKVRRIYFSGGGEPRNAAPEKEGSFHHGPAPYILHVHFNITPKNLLRLFLKAHGVGSLPFIDLSGHP